MSNTDSYIIVTDEDIKHGVSELTMQSTHMKRVYEKVGPPPLRRREAGFEGLVRIILGQQLSVASANAIWKKFEGVIEVVEAGRCQAMSEEELRACGISRPKIRTLRAVCEAIGEGELDLDPVSSFSHDEISQHMTKIRGIGPWTADIYIMFCLGHRDAWAPGDLALQYAVQNVLSLTERPNAKAMIDCAECWRPWRGVAARLLWAYYSVMKDNKSGVPV